ncbi:hypothetical protein E6C76_07520 [Pseudothauera nasutitermitis]|uniref:Uncharacterized protein n=1 Tax=Pseudothauera nasutitermitis TaxID=2565930 RepID=A0A4S4AZ51_9RHOO|nr:hypothetical protein [Pseudothauera nasutitermitis]THF65438.1 hypothetical protein E6C76_07520 [Pseudothauera nasutitermitis]
MRVAGAAARRGGRAGCPQALAAAIRAGQTPLVLGFCRALSPAAVPTPEAGLELAQEIARFATRLRLPHGRNGAWKSHLELLEAAAVLLEHVAPELASEALQAQARRDLARLRRMCGTVRRPAARDPSGSPDHEERASVS